MKCYGCGEVAWCVDNSGNVQEHNLCYDCSFLEELAVDEQISAMDEAFDEPCICGAPSCDGTCEVAWEHAQDEDLYYYGTGALHPLDTMEYHHVEDFYDTVQERPYIFGIDKMRPENENVPF